MEELHNHESQLQNKSNGGSYSRSGSNGPHSERPTLKSNLRKRTTTVGDNQHRLEKRKVSWPDAHGKDIAHVQEFEPRYNLPQLLSFHDYLPCVVLLGLRTAV
ncbi:hypothetical protein CJ030_MR8G011185 [Morella rubra]|uniref:Uncharacterized protein n=1 Tax=Morella rubra TaxID=262757 RepID=A0A6A1UTV8_9ROSI|nr:hypothetical protein CJ030_MR8G011185 [Morella rubra]